MGNRLMCRHMQSIDISNTRTSSKYALASVQLESNQTVSAHAPIYTDGDLVSTGKDGGNSSSNDHQRQQDAPG